MSAIMNIASGVDIVLLRISFVVVRLAVSIEVMPGYSSTSMPTVNLT